MTPAAAELERAGLTQRPPKAAYAGILVCSLAVLMQEILLTRIFSFTIWYHMAYLAISTALLGFGSAGAMLTLMPGLVERHPRRLSAWSAAAAGVALLVGMAIVAQRPLRPDRMLAEPGWFAMQLAGYYAVVCVPFWFGGLAVVAPLSAWPVRANRLYAADLLGAGLGCAAAVAALTFLDGETAVFACAALFVAAGALYVTPSRLAGSLAALAAVLLAAAPFADRALAFRPTISKTLASATELSGARTLFTRWSPVNRVDVFGVPGFLGGFWTAWGRSGHYTGTPPASVSIVYDGHNGSDVYKIRGRESLEVLDYHILSTPYLFQERPRVLVIGVGGGIDILNALYHDASRVTGVDLQPITIRLLDGPLAHWTGGWLQRPEVELVAAEGRHYVRSHADTWDLIQITAVDTFSAQTTGAYVLAESYLYTVEGIGDFLSKLAPDGMLSIVAGDHYYNDPAIASPFGTRLALVAREALRRRGIRDPKPHLLLVGQAVEEPDAPPEKVVRGAWIQNLLVKKSPFTAAELARLREFAGPNLFSVRLSPDGHHRDPHIARVVHARDDELAQVIEAQTFAIDPITDDRPFFFHVLRWNGLTLDQRVDWDSPGAFTSQIVLLLMLAQAMLLGGVFIALPLVRRTRGDLPAASAARYLAYFLALGLGFLLIEISFVQKYVLFLGYPTYSLSVTIFSLLVFAAAGAWLSQRGWARPRRLLAGMLTLTVILVAIEIVVMPRVREALLFAPLGARLAATALFQLPLGLALGTFFPTGLELLRQRRPALIPWAWAVNGIGSVAAAVLAVLLGMEIGFSGVALVALAIYCAGTGALLVETRDQFMPTTEPESSSAVSNPKLATSTTWR